MSLSTVRWGIIGCGDVTEVKSGPAFSKIANSELVAVMRRNGELARDYAERHHVPKWYDDADKLIHDPEVNAIYIATPPAFHKEYAIKAAAAGKPIYVEKPMALNYEECVEMIKACADRNVPLYVAYYRRALPKFLKVKEIIESGILGDIRFAMTTHYRSAGDKEVDTQSPSWRVQPDLAGGGLFFDVASHTIDIFDFLLGPVKEVKGFASNQHGAYQAEDIVTATYIFESGVHGTGTWCFSASEEYEMNEIIGSNGKVTFSTFGEEPVRLISSQGEEQWSFENPIHIQQPFIETVVSDLLGTGKCSCTGKIGARTNWFMDELVKEYYKK
ncbi:Gfo/Idh/MocA family oxidoreductase [Bacillus sp. FJAT-50079]|uniref:Gfo/Idh/MocA family protein n=1 Tax=Bacillus sp. FJAT-50079 TaxID=2833577 RepID=UPI001BCA0E19|nr:Gfo/Idh/MocA family oxidoreductase [Bacillus sp. FJAT-50079]MBS4208142.1 Gfo/Idh/MocA family oxidoreductase [Bacillus sp. FJAT-50079]